MKIESLGCGRLKIWMSERDMNRWGLRFERMDAQDTATRAAITKMLTVARQRDYPSAAEDLTVEAVPVEGGCVFLFTPRRPRPLFRMPPVQIYTISSADTLLRLGDALRRQSPLPLSSLYRMGEEYRLLVYPALFPSALDRRLLAEYTDWAGEGAAAAAWVEEHGTPVAVGNALSALCQALGSPSQEPPGPPR